MWFVVLVCDVVCVIDLLVGVIGSEIWVLVLGVGDGELVEG